MIRILVVDDHQAFREPLAFMLDREADFEVVAQAGSLAEARAALAGVDVAIVDIELPDGNGVDLVHDMSAANPDGLVLVVTGSRSRLELATAIEAGAAAVLHKTVSIGQIIDAVRRLAAGEQIHSPREIVDLLRLADQRRRPDLTAKGHPVHLTPRELDVLQALAEGRSDKEIAQRLQIVPKTVRTHMANLLTKLDAASRLQALVIAIRRGIVKIE